jgi:hypothetical protein
MAPVIVLTDTVQTWGYSATVHYSHVSRAVVAQSALALHMEFNSNVGPNPIYRSYGLIRTAVVGGSTITVNGPTLVATDLTELHVELITDNGASVAVVNQFDTTGTFVGAPQVATSVRRVAFIRRSNGTTAYAHSTKVFAGGRDISEREAVDFATSNLATLGVNSADVDMQITTDADSSNHVAGERIDSRSQ